MNTTQDLLTRALASLQHLHTLHGPCDGKTCPHAAVIRELESALFTESSLQPECTCALYLWPHSLACPCHPQNLGRAMELTVGGKPWEMPSSPPLTHDPHDLASALIAATTRTREWRDME